MPTSARVINVLHRVAGTDEVLRNPDILLFEGGVLDSLGLVELIVGLEEEFGIEIAPAEIEREQWATPRKISTYIEALVGA
jgi:D-alanine--poly(phosphoribitol) ligase subunit 2